MAISAHKSKKIVRKVSKTHKSRSRKSSKKMSKRSSKMSKRSSKMSKPSSKISKRSSKMSRKTIKVKKQSLSGGSKKTLKYNLKGGNWCNDPNYKTVCEALSSANTPKLLYDTIIGNQKVIEQSIAKCTAPNFFETNLKNTLHLFLLTNIRDDDLIAKSNEMSSTFKTRTSKTTGTTGTFYIPNVYNLRDVFIRMLVKIGKIKPTDLKLYLS
jgi:hypothetical protein